MDNPNITPPYAPTPAYMPPSYPAGKRELIFGVALLVCALLVCNFTLFGGLNLGFAIGTVLCTVCATVYLWPAGKKNGYALTVLGLCGVIAAGFARSDDGFVKFIMLLFLYALISLGLMLLAGKNRRSSGSVSSLAESCGIFFELGFGKLDATFRGMGDAVRAGGKLSKNTTSVGLGLLIALPVLAVMIPLLIRADAAFDGLMQLLPEFSFTEFFATVLFGSVLWALLLSCSMGLRLEERKRNPSISLRRGLAVLTLNTVLIAVCVVYAVYLLSQLAYFVGGFAGILPQEYTLAQYARRGFFEMAWLCAINLGIIICSMAFSAKRDPAPLLTRLLCLFLGAVTVFFVATASAKMFFYIEAFGLTRLRVLTQIVMLFLALTTVIVCVWLFVPKMRYMQAVVLSALVIGAAVIWVDVDTQVANYNVDAYLSGKLDSVDVDYLGTLNDGAVPALYRLSQEAPSQTVADQATEVLNSRYQSDIEDFRSWNYASHTASGYLPEISYPQDETYDYRSTNP